MIVPPRDRGRYQGLIGATFAAASIAGPALGGFIVDNASWRWIFYVNLPVGVLALLVISITMPKRTEKREHSIDYRGSVLLAAGTTSLLLGARLGRAAVRVELADRWSAPSSSRRPARCVFAFGRAAREGADPAV